MPVIPPDPSSGGAEARDVTLLLQAMANGSAGAEERLLEVVYAELRAIAGAFFKAQGPEHTLQPTALVHEAFIKLVGNRDTAWEGRSHFIAVAAKAMRHVLIDHARRARALRRGGEAQRVTLSGIFAHERESVIDALDVDSALTRLASVDERQARVVELRFFAGLSVPEVGRVLGVSDRTVELDWRLARAWLRRELGARVN